MLYGVFISISADIRHLHSFPTRRSSDLAAVLPADADLQVGPGSPAEPDRQLDELADALLIEHLERVVPRSEEHTSELQSHSELVCRLLLEKKKIRHELEDVTKELYQMLV